jgi:hypothetical protein
MELKEFIEDTKKHLVNFEEYWMVQSKNDPVNFPMHFSEDNAGLWYEMFLIYLQGQD